MPQSPSPSSLEQVRQALRRAFQLGQTYWMHADSESLIQHQKADVVQARFDSLVEETCAALSAVEALGQQAEPVGYASSTALQNMRLGVQSVAAIVDKVESVQDGDDVPLYASLAALQQQEAGSLPSVPALVPAGQVVAWMWQHEETGTVGFIDQWQIDNGWQAANPRLRLIRPLVFAACAPSPTEPAGVKEVPRG